MSDFERRTWDPRTASSASLGLSIEQKVTNYVAMYGRLPSAAQLKKLRGDSERPR